MHAVLGAGPHSEYRPGRKEQDHGGRWDPERQQAEREAVDPLQRRPVMARTSKSRQQRSRQRKRSD